MEFTKILPNDVVDIIMTYSNPFKTLFTKTHDEILYTRSNNNFSKKYICLEAFHNDMNKKREAVKIGDTLYIVNGIIKMKDSD